MPALSEIRRDMNGAGGRSDQRFEETHPPSFRLGDPRDAPAQGFCRVARDPLLANCESENQTVEIEGSWQSTGARRDCPFPTGKGR
jgi:hypothetical protein